MNKVACALTIAGTDPSGGAGIQADLKTFQELQTYGMSVLTSIVAQNTTGVQDIHHLPLSMIEQQLDSVLSDMPVHAFKTGMIANIDMMQVIAKKISDLNVPYVMDPVMVATSGDALINQEARIFLKEHLLPLTAVVTP
ncbi:bifunctional hydroxymethylpyrimidine kinase/phosphomethylpyrimidine kinase, partial [Virgibacillus halodenitrificans]|nr:bifunctional hydroxymethylpyrimidine kinase/phosphomethylpyrimidine kinase [Virgibacillus halodenitrificans]